MPHYHRLGHIPDKRHIQFRQPDGSLYHEQLFSTEGFSNDYSLLYHCQPPTAIRQMDDRYAVAPQIAQPQQLCHRSLMGFQIAPAADYLQSRQPVLVNADCAISLAAPQNSMTNYFFKNADADEIIFIHVGSGTLKTMYGSIPFEYGDYLVVPRGTVYQMHFDTPDNRLFIVESHSPVVYPKRYLSDYGQLMEHSPFCERDIKQPRQLETHSEKGDFSVLIKKENWIYPYHYLYHPFDVVGWDGCCYPYGFSIHNFEPITGRVHQPPPVHQTFQARGFVVCSFVPRLLTSICSCN